MIEKRKEDKEKEGEKTTKEEKGLKTSLVVQWIRGHLKIGDTGSIPGPGRFHMQSN